jgi:zinc/manganese transport system ATP-binding protein
VPSSSDDVVCLSHACLAFGDRTLWHDLTLSVRAGEFIAVLGPNGTGKTSLLKVLLGQLRLSGGTATVAGGIGYVPQHRPVDPGLALRGRDLVGLGYDGHRWGVASLRRRDRRARNAIIDRALHQVNGDRLGGVPVGVMSGGEMQRMRIAQALATDPVLLLCDEPLLNLDPANARLVAGLIDRRRREAATAVLFVTHEINPVLDVVDKVLYLAPAGHRVGTPEEVLTTASLSELYGTRVEVLRHGGRVLIAATGAHADHECHPGGLLDAEGAA